MGQTVRAKDDDLQDIEACLSGNEESYGRIVKRYQSEITKLMWRFSRNSVLCEELVQEVFVEAYFSLSSYRAEAPFSHWLKRIASRVGYRFWKNRDREKGKLSLEDYDGPIEDENGEVAPEEAGRILHDMLEQLGDADRLVLTLMYFDDCGTREIAERMGWTRAMVKMRASRARKKLKTLAERSGLLEDLAWIR